MRINPVTTATAIAAAALLAFQTTVASADRAPDRCTVWDPHPTADVIQDAWNPERPTTDTPRDSWRAGNSVAGAPQRTWHRPEPISGPQVRAWAPHELIPGRSYDPWEPPPTPSDACPTG